jgi:hypothetical protein
VNFERFQMVIFFSDVVMIISIKYFLKKKWPLSKCISDTILYHIYSFDTFSEANQMGSGPNKVP